MTTKRYYISAILIVIASVLFMSISYSKKSGTITFPKKEIVIDGIKTIYKTNNKTKVNRDDINNYIHGEYISFLVINENSQDKDYKIQVECQDCINKIYYSLDNQYPELLTTNEIKVGILKKYGTYGDMKNHTLIFVTNEDYIGEVKINIK